MATEDRAFISADINLSALRLESQERFERLTEVLVQVRKSLSEIAEDTDRLASLISEIEIARDGSDELQTACHRLSHLLTGTRQALATSDLTEAIAEGLYGTETLERECRHLRAIASMTRVTGHSVRIEAIEEYILNLREMIQSLGISTFKVQNGLLSVRSAIGCATELLGDAALRAERAIVAECVGGPPDTTNSIENVAKSLSAQLRESMSANTQIFMKGIQFSDAFAQRLQHVEIILAEGANIPAASTLGRAQISAMATDARTVLTTTQEALEQLRSVGQSAAAALAGDTGEQASRLLTAWREELSGGQHIERMVAPRLEEAKSAVTSIEDAVDAAKDNLETLSMTALDVTLATVNAGLLARRSGSAKAAMDVLSVTVRERADACSEMNAICRASFADIERLIREADFSQLGTSIRELHDLLFQGSENLNVAAEMFQRLESMRYRTEQGAIALQHSVDKGLEALASIPDLIDRIDAGVSVFAGTSQVVTAEDAAKLRQFEYLYTMDSEREVHAALVGRNVVAAKSSAVPAEQNLDDILF